MRILLAYSIRHFNPQTMGEFRPGCGMSAAVLARTLYEELQQFGEVDYVDGLKPPSRLKYREYDLYVGIQGALTPLEQLASFKYKVLFSVNMHPVERNRILQEVGKTYRLCKARHINRNCVHLSQVDDIERADAILMVGNSTVLHSYVRWGKPLHQLRCINYASCSSSCTPSSCSSSRAPMRMLYVATEMCLRKGFDIVEELLLTLQCAGCTIQTHIIGGSGDAEYRQKLERLQKQLGDSICVHGWVDSASQHYAELLRACDFILFPSLEEGQAGSVLDAMSQGVIPLVSRETGIDWSPLGYLEARPACKSNKELIRSLKDLSPQQVAALKEETLTYYRDWHEHWRVPLRRILNDIVSRHSLWPALYVETPCKALWEKIKKIYPGVTENKQEATYALRINDEGATIVPETVFDMVDFLEKHPHATHASYRGEALQGLNWRKLTNAPDDMQGWHVCSLRSVGEPQWWQMESAHGAATSIIPLSPKPKEIQPIKYWKRLVMPLAWLGGKLAPSRQHRKLLFNIWKKFQMQQK